jgi:hypothetical protein
MTEIAIRAASITEKIAYSDNLACSNMLPRQFQDKPANVLWAIEYGETLGITPMAAITGIHVIENKPGASAALIGGLVRRAGHKLRVTGNNQRAVAQIIRSDDPDYTFEVTWELKQNERGNPNAEDAGLLGKQVWKNYPAAMLKARAITQVARDACEEVLFGLHYTPEELGAETDADGNPVELRTARRGAIAEDAWQTPAQAVFHNIDPNIGNKPAEEYADVVEDAPEPARASDGQRESIGNGLRTVRGITDPVGMLIAVQQIVGRELAGPTELTPEEAESVLTTLREEHRAKTRATRQASEAEIAPDVPPTYVSGSQLTALKQALAEIGIGDRTALLAWCGSKLGRQLGAMKDLTVEEADRLLAELTPPETDNAPLMDRLTAAMHSAVSSDELADVSERMWTEHEAGNLTQADVSKLQDISLKRESEIVTTGKAAA